MSIEQTEIIDIVTIDDESGDVWLTISDHLDWLRDESRHLMLLQEKVNAYLRFIESDELLQRIPESRDRKIVIDLVAMFPLSPQAEMFYKRAADAIQSAGFKLQFRQLNDVR